MRTFFVLAFLLFDLTLSAATLTVEVNRQGFTGPLEIAVAPRVEGKPPEWSAKKTLAAGKSAVRFDLGEGLYFVLASGPQPLQRVSAKTNIGADGSTLHLVIPKSKTVLRATLAGEPIIRAEIALTHDELRWRTDVQTDDDGKFAGDLWEPARYIASVWRDRMSAPHRVNIWLSPDASNIDVPDRHIRGRVLDDDGKPLAGALVSLRTEGSESTLTMRTHSAPDGQFEFFGVREGSHMLAARAATYLDSDAARFELHGVSAEKALDLKLTRGEPREIRVIDARGHPIDGASVVTSCNGEVKATSITNSVGSADVASLRGASCAVYVLPKEGSIAVERLEGTERLTIRVPEGTSSLRLALKTDAGVAFSDLRLLMRIDGKIVPPEIARILGSRGLSLATNEEGNVSLQHIPPGTYEFWPYRTNAEGQMICEYASEFEAPISVKVLTGENNATIRFQAR
jgi:carboxypeptidase family protein